MKQPQPGDLIIPTSDWYIHPDIVLHETTYEWGDPAGWTDCVQSEPGLAVAVLNDFHWPGEAFTVPDEHNIKPITFVLLAGTMGWIYTDRLRSAP